MQPTMSSAADGVNRSPGIENILSICMARGLGEFEKP